VEFDLSPDQELLRSTTSSFLESGGGIGQVRELNAKGSSFDPAWWRQGADLGWTSFLVPEDQGGGAVSDCGLVDAAIVAEEMGRVVAPGPFLVNNVVASALATAANAADFADVIDGIVSGQVIATWGVLCPDRGWSAAGSSLRASRSDGHWELSGVLDRVEAAGQATHLLVLAESEEGPVQLLVPVLSDGVTIEQQQSLDFVRQFGRIGFDSVLIDQSAVVGTPGGAASAVERQLDIAAVLQCAETVGAVDRVLEFTTQWMFDRYSFGRPLASYQALKHRIADIKLWYEACQATTSAAARAVGQHRSDGAELASVAASYVGQHATDIIQDCVQLHGGLGVTWEHDIHLYLRRASVNRVMWGTPSDHRRRIADILEI
jgi:alkylation response protein AidB-like acyl-CoA dehydrogenase